MIERLLWPIVWVFCVLAEAVQNIPFQSAARAAMRDAIDPDLDDILVHEPPSCRAGRLLTRRDQARGQLSGVG